MSTIVVMNLVSLFVMQLRLPQSKGFGTTQKLAMILEGHTLTTVPNHLSWSSPCSAQCTLY